MKFEMEFGLCAVYFMCTGIGYKAQEKCEYFEKLEQRDKSPCKHYRNDVIKKSKERQWFSYRCIHPESIKFAYNHKNPEEHAAGMRETFLVKSGKYEKALLNLLKKNAKLSKRVEELENGNR